MKTRSIAQAGMLCAVYGVLIFFNAISGLWMESIFPYLFALPILYLSMKEEPSVSFCALAAMLLLTWMLSGLSTWLIAGSMLACGCCFGYGLKKRYGILGTSIVSFVILFVINWLEITVLAALFGFDGAEERQIFAHISSVISWNGFLVLLAGVQAFLQSFAMACMSILLALKVLKRREILTLKLSVGISSAFAWAFCVIFPIWVLGVCGVLSFPVEIRDLLLFGVIVCLIACIWQGCRMILARMKQPKRWQVMLCVLGAFLFPLNLVEAGAGFFSLIRKSFRHKSKTRGSIR